MMKPKTRRPKLETRKVFLDLVSFETTYAEREKLEQSEGESVGRLRIIIRRSTSL